MVQFVMRIWSFNFFTSSFICFLVHLLPHHGRRKLVQQAHLKGHVVHRPFVLKLLVVSCRLAINHSCGSTPTVLPRPPHAASLYCCPHHALLCIGGLDELTNWLPLLRAAVRRRAGHHLYFCFKFICALVVRSPANLLSLLVHVCSCC